MVDFVFYKFLDIYLTKFLRDIETEVVESIKLLIHLNITIFRKLLSFA